MKKNIRLVFAFGCTLMTYYTSAQVGIGTTTPQQELHISGTTAGLQTIRIDDCAVTIGGTNPGELATTTTTTSKAVYSDTNGDLQVRYAYGDNTQSIILPTGTQNIDNTTLTDITAATITFTPRHSTIYLSFAISGYNPLCNTNQQSYFIVGVNNNGSNVGNFLSLSATTDDLTGASGAATITAANFPLTVTPGSPVTIKLQGRDGGTVHDCGFTIDTTNYSSYITILD